MRWIHWARLACSCVLTFAGLAPTVASSFPVKPITLVVPFAAGSGTDQLARAIAQALQTTFPGTAVVVDNKPGAGGMLAAQAVAKAPPDGHTLFVTTNTTQSANPHLFKKLSYDPVGDFAPLAALARGSMVLVVPTSSPYKTVEELIAAGKKNTLRFGAGNSSTRVGSEMFGQMTGIPLLHIPYKSNPQALTDLIGGQFDFMMPDTATAMPLVNGGKLRALAYAGSKRAAALPELPTLIEAGVKGFELYYWVAAYAPKGTPPEIVNRLNQALISSVRHETVTAVYGKSMIEAFTTTPQGLADFQRMETDKWGRVIRAAGIEPE